jgi:hypothetical protein
MIRPEARATTLKLALVSPRPSGNEKETDVVKIGLRLEDTVLTATLIDSETTQDFVRCSHWR